MTLLQSRSKKSVIVLIICAIEITFVKFYVKCTLSRSMNVFLIVCVLFLKRNCKESSSEGSSGNDESLNIEDVPES